MNAGTPISAEVSNNYFITHFPIKAEEGEEHETGVRTLFFAPLNLAPPHTEELCD